MKRNKFVKERKFMENKSSFDQDKCVVCFLPFEEEDRIAILPCNHIFHVDCVKKWIDQKEAKGQYCIICNSKICRDEADIENSERSTVLELVDVDRTRVDDFSPGNTEM